MTGPNLIYTRTVTEVYQVRMFSLCYRGVHVVIHPYIGTLETDLLLLSTPNER